MQHIVNVAFDFDDKKISESIESQVHREVVNNITEEVKKIIFEKKWGYSSKSYDETDPTPLKKMIENRVSEVLEENKDVIIDGAMKLLADKLSRTKQVKEAVGKLMG